MHNPLSKARTMSEVSSYAQALAADARVVFDRASNILIALAVIGVAALCTMAIAAFR